MYKNKRSHVEQEEEEEEKRDRTHYNMVAEEERLIT